MPNPESPNDPQGTDRVDALMESVRHYIGSHRVLKRRAEEAAEWLVTKHARESDETLVATLRGLLPPLLAEKLNVFFSYKARDRSIAKAIAQKLESWSAGKLKIKHMANLGVDEVGRNWREEIEKTIPQCDWFLLLLPAPGDQRDWVLYEAGYFSRGQGLTGRLVCLHHPDNEVADALGAHQSVPAKVEAVRDFLEALFHHPNWIPGMPALNPDLNELDAKSAEIVELIQPPTSPGVKFCCGPHMEVRFEDASAVRGWEQLERGHVIDSNEDCKRLFGLHVHKPLFGDWVREVLGEFDLRLMLWGDGSGVPTSGENLVIVGTDNNSLLHFRIFDANGQRVRDTDETKLPSTQERAIQTLKQRLPDLQSHELSEDEKTNVVTEVTSIVRQILPEKWITQLARAVRDVSQGRDLQPINASFCLRSGRRVQPRICAVRRSKTDGSVNSIDILFNDAARADVAQPSYALAAQPNGPPLPVLGVRGMLTQYYVEKATHAREIDIITLTMHCVFDFYGYGRILEWLREGKRIRILTLAPRACAAVARGAEEKHPELPAKIRHQVEGSAKRLYDEAQKDPDGRRGFKGSFEIHWHKLIPYFAYFRADDEVAVGLYYTHLRGMCSESLQVPRTSPLFTKMKDHFEGLWGRDDEWAGRLCYIGRDECQLCPLPDVNGREE